MPELVVGFDSAWTPTNSGALVGAVLLADGGWEECGPPVRADFVEAEQQILAWQDAHSPRTTLVFLDQPTIVRNTTGQRPVENLVSSPIGLRYGGVQPSNTGRTEMFGPSAPVWSFLDRFGGPAVPGESTAGTHVFETYPVLTMIALDWLLSDTRPTGRLPKYKPGRRTTFSLSDWRYVSAQAAGFTAGVGLCDLSEWLVGLSDLENPRNPDQDKLDACLCLIAAVHAILSRKCLIVGDIQSGYIVVPYSEALETELSSRCETTGRTPGEWLQETRLF